MFLRVLTLISACFVAATCLAVGPAGAGARHTCFGEPATIVGTSGDDVIEGTAGDDVIVGLGGDDRITTSPGTDAGVDLVCGGAGADTLVGRFGMYSGGRGPDSIESLGHLSGGRGHDELRAAAVSGAFANVVIDGGPGNDVLEGSDQNIAILRGGPGKDSITGVQSLEEGDLYSDVLDYSTSRSAVVVDLDAGEAFGEGHDTFRLIRYPAREGIEAQLRVVIGSSLDDTLIGTELSDSLTGYVGNDRIIGRAGRDSLSGGAGDDRIWGGSGHDTIRGGAGDDLLHAGRGHDTLDVRSAPGGVRVDLRSERAKGWGVDVIIGFLRVFGSDHDDRILGDGRDNRLFGGSGGDLLDGRGGSDFGDGGSGRDRCVRIEESRSC